MKEATSIVELALWKHEMNDYSQGKKNRRTKKKMKIEDADVRVQCRISCGADIVIQHMLPYFLPTASKVDNAFKSANEKVDSPNNDESDYE